MTTTTAPCPRWCTRPPGHPFEDIEENGRVLLRAHERGWPLSDQHGEYARVFLYAEEEATSPCGPTLLDGPHVRLAVSEDALLSPAQARQLAALLNAAALAEAGAR